MKRSDFLRLAALLPFAPDILAAQEQEEWSAVRGESVDLIHGDLWAELVGPRLIVGPGDGEPIRVPWVLCENQDAIQSRYLGPNVERLHGVLFPDGREVRFRFVGLMEPGHVTQVPTEMLYGAWPVEVATRVAGENPLPIIAP